MHKNPTPSFCSSSVSDHGLSVDLKTDREKSLEKGKPSKAKGLSHRLPLRVVKEPRGTKGQAGNRDQPCRLLERGHAVRGAPVRRGCGG